MYKSIAKQLNLDERQTRQLRLELESQSWLYSDSVVRRALAIYGYAMLGYLIIFGPLMLLLVLFMTMVQAMQL